MASYLAVWHCIACCSIKWQRLWRGYTLLRKLLLESVAHMTSFKATCEFYLCMYLGKKKGVDKEIPPTPCTPESSFLSSAGAQESDSSKNSLPLRLKHWQTQLILGNVYFTFVCIIHIYIYIYKHTYIYIYKCIHRYTLCLYIWYVKKYSWRRSCPWVGKS